MNRFLKILLLISFVLAVDFSISYGFYSWFVKLLFKVDDDNCIVDGYGYELYREMYPSGIFYVCVPHVFVHYSFSEEEYSNVKTKLIEYKNKSHGIQYIHWNNDTETDCYNNVITKYSISGKIGYCRSTYKTKIPECLCRIKKYSGDDNECCKYGYVNVELFIFSSILVGLIMIFLNIIAFKYCNPITYRSPVVMPVEIVDVSPV